MINVEDIIKKLQELDNNDYKVYMEVDPIVECAESCDGMGWETTRYRYLITLESKDYVRPYKNNHGIREYIDEEK